MKSVISPDDPVMEKKMKIVNLNRENLHFMQTSKVKCVNKA